MWLIFLGSQCHLGINHLQTTTVSWNYGDEKPILGWVKHGRTEHSPGCPQDSPGSKGYLL